MSIESREIKDIHTLYQNLYEETARERMRKNKERIKNPFGNVTIEKEDGSKLKKGDPGFDQELEKGRKTVRDANNKSLEGRGGNSNNNTSNNNTQSSSAPNGSGGRRTGIDGKGSVSYTHLTLPTTPYV